MLALKDPAQDQTGVDVSCLGRDRNMDAMVWRGKKRISLEHPEDGCAVSRYETTKGAPIRIECQKTAWKADHLKKMRIWELEDVENRQDTPGVPMVNLCLGAWCRARPLSHPPTPTRWPSTDD